MSILSKSIITKEEAYHICDKSQYGEASLTELIRLNLRILYCKETRLYVRRNCKLSGVLKPAKSLELSSIDKEDMNIMFQKALQKQ